MKKKILIVDDSIFIREFLTEIISAEMNLEVVGQASNGQEACDMTVSLKPDVVLMDIHMPEMSGIDATEWIMNNNPTPIIIVTNDDTKETAMKAIEVGALEVVLKPTINDIEDKVALSTFFNTIHRISDVKKSILYKKQDFFKNKNVLETLQKLDLTSLNKEMLPFEIITVASSTGGPKVLHEILPQLEEIPVPIVVTQHLSKDFAEQMILWLDKSMKRDVIFAKDGATLNNSTIVFSPPEIHVSIEKNGVIKLLDEPKVNFQKPSADYMFSSAAKSYGAKAMAVILTGMGKDGAKGILDVFNSGGYTIAQDEDSCVVFGMPKEAIKLKAVKEVLPYFKIPNRIKELISK